MNGEIAQTLLVSAQRWAEDRCGDADHGDAEDGV